MSCNTNLIIFVAILQRISLVTHSQTTSCPSDGLNPAYDQCWRSAYKQINIGQTFSLSFDTDCYSPYVEFYISSFATDDPPSTSITIHYRDNSDDDEYGIDTNITYTNSFDNFTADSCYETACQWSNIIVSNDDFSRHNMSATFKKKLGFTQLTIKIVSLSGIQNLNTGYWDLFCKDFINISFITNQPSLSPTDIPSPSVEPTTSPITTKPGSTVVRTTITSTGNTKSDNISTMHVMTSPTGTDINDDGGTSEDIDLAIIIIITLAGLTFIFIISTFILIYLRKKQKQRLNLNNTTSTKLKNGNLYTPNGNTPTNIVPIDDEQHEAQHEHERDGSGNVISGLPKPNRFKESVSIGDQLEGDGGVGIQKVSQGSQRSPKVQEQEGGFIDNEHDGHIDIINLKGKGKSKSKHKNDNKSQSTAMNESGEADDADNDDNDNDDGEGLFGLYAKPNEGNDDENSNENETSDGTLSRWPRSVSKIIIKTKTETQSGHHHYGRQKSTRSLTKLRSTGGSTRSLYGHGHNRATSAASLASVSSGARTPTTPSGDFDD